MAFQGLTPEALVQRSDSKNPATTCKGLTSSGRPCRRTLGSTSSSSPAPSPGTSRAKNARDTAGVVAILESSDAAAFFCWQHKDQAQNLVARVNYENENEKARKGKQGTRIVKLEKRSSIDTLAERVGVLNLENAPTEKMRGLPAKKKMKKRDTLPVEWQGIQGPLMSVPEEIRDAIDPPSPRKPGPKQGQYGRSNVRASWACCIRADEDYNDDGPPARRRDRDEIHQSRFSQGHSRPSSYSRPAAQHQSMQEWPQNDSTPPRQRPRQTSSPRHAQTHQVTPTRPSPRPTPSASPPHSDTQNFLSLIPNHLDPGTTSALLSELSKPFPKDDEPGYIYIFWLTPTTEPSVPDDDVASTILDGDLDYQDDMFPSSSRRLSNAHGASARKRARALDRYASLKRPSAPPKILLKIGRAQNVHRRMTQWTKQCNQNITLVRYYPHYNSTEAAAKSAAGRMVPHVSKVERLIHLELRGMGMGFEKGKCEVCEREHREWFEVTATTEGLRGVDSVVRRWVAWSERLPET